MALDKKTIDTAVEVVKENLTKENLDLVVEKVKDFFKNLLNPNMTLDDIADVASPRLDEIIIKNNEKGLEYSAGKFTIKFVDDEHFQLSFEMYFKDGEGKWHKAANESELRDIKLLHKDAAESLKKRKEVTYPIEAPVLEEKKSETPSLEK